MKLVKIIIGAKAKEPLFYVNSVEAIKDMGLVGDRYYKKEGSFNKKQFDQNVRDITIFDFDALSECNKRLNANLDFLDLRRNLIIKDFDYEILKDKIFYIGEAQFKIVRTAPPCKFLSRLTHQDMMIGLKYIGGFRAKIIKSGIIKVGDGIIPI